MNTFFVDMVSVRDRHNNVVCAVLDYIMLSALFNYISIRQNVSVLYCNKLSGVMFPLGQHNTLLPTAMSKMNAKLH